MANYNVDLSFGAKQWEGTKINVRAGGIGRVASNGTVRIRYRQSTVKADIQVVHGLLEAADIAAFKTFFNTNKLIPFLFSATEDAVSRSVVFSPEKPYDTQVDGVGRVLLTVFLREV